MQNSPEMVSIGSGNSYGVMDEDESKIPNFARTGRSWNQSMSTSGSVGGSPSSRSDQAVTTPARESAIAKLNHLDLHGDQGDEDGSPLGTGGKKKKRGNRAPVGDKTGRGLRQFSMKVCEKVESKGRTTYNEVADELVAEFANPGIVGSPDQFDEKNIRRRVYDALNVLMAMDIISKDKKEIQWKGLPRTSLSDIEELKVESIALKSRIEKKAAYLQELEEQIVGLQNLVQRNKQLHGSGSSTSGVALPFILVQTRPHATVEVEISEDMQLVHFDFNSTPFELHDDAYVLKAMRFCDKQQSEGQKPGIPPLNGGECSRVPRMYQHSLPQNPLPRPSITNIPGKPSSSPPVPGILKGHTKRDHL